MAARKFSRTPKSAPSSLDPAKTQLHALFMALRDIENVAMVCADALRYQNEPTGMSVAYLLRRAVGDRLGVEINRLSRLLKRSRR